MSIECTDQTGRKLILPAPPKTIVSLVPSITETLVHCCDPGSIIGRTKFCIHPKEDIQHILVIGGTKHVKVSLINSISPDIIIANKEENTKSDVEMLAREHMVYVSDIYDTRTLLEFLKDMNIIFRKTSFNDLSSKIIHARFMYSYPLPQKKVVYLIWRKPFMTVGGDTFINHMIEEAGMINVFRDLKRYPEVSMEEIIHRRPDYLLLSSEPYPFKQKHIDEISVNFNKEKIKIVDGEMFSWYGIRILKAYEYFKKLHTEL